MKLFQFRWANFNTKLGLIFMVASLIFFNVLGVLDFPVYPAGFASLLAWITIILAPGQKKQRYLSGLLVFLFVGVLLTIITGFLVEIDNNPLWIISLGIVSFIGFMMLRKGVHHYMIAWCLVYWYMLVPLFFQSDNLTSLLIALASGTGLVFIMNLFPFVWSNVWSNKAETAIIEATINDQEPQTTPSSNIIIRYAIIVSISLMSGVAAGIKWLVTDPSIIANATLNMIGPSFKQTWIAAVERALLGFIGIVGGFYVGWYFTNPLIGQFVIALCSFFALGFLFVNAGLVVGIFFFLTAYGWGGLQSEQAHLFANEKIVGELVGVVIAVIAIGLLNVFTNKRINL